MNLPSLKIVIEEIDPQTTPADFAQLFALSDIIKPRKFAMFGLAMLLFKDGKFDGPGTYIIRGRLNRRLKVIGEIRKY